MIAYNDDCLYNNNLVNSPEQIPNQLSNRSIILEGDGLSMLDDQSILAGFNRALTGFDVQARFRGAPIQAEPTEITNGLLINDFIDAYTGKLQQLPIKTFNNLTKPAQQYKRAMKLIEDGQEIGQLEKESMRHSSLVVSISPTPGIICADSLRVAHDRNYTKRIKGIGSQSLALITKVLEVPERHAY